MYDEKECGVVKRNGWLLLFDGARISKAGLRLIIERPALFSRSEVWEHYTRSAAVDAHVYII